MGEILFAESMCVVLTSFDDLVIGGSIRRWQGVHPTRCVCVCVCVCVEVGGGGSGKYIFVKFSEKN